MFTAIGNMSNACCGDVRAAYFQGQQYVELTDMVIGIIALIIGVVLFSQGYQLAGTSLMCLSAFQGYLITANISALIRAARLKS